MTDERRPDSADSTVGLMKDLMLLFERDLRTRVADPDLDLLAGGLMDSLVLVDLLVALERAYSIPIEMEDLDFDDFRTLRGITAWVERQRK